MLFIKDARALAIYSLTAALALCTSLSCSNQSQTRKDAAEREAPRSDADLDAPARLGFRVGPTRDFEQALSLAPTDSTPLEPATAKTLRAQLPQLPDPATLMMNASADFPARSVAAQAMGEGAPSAENSPETPAPFELVGTNCVEDHPCQMGGDIRLAFNHPIEARDSFADLIKVEPAIEDLEIKRHRVLNKRLELVGATQPDTTYKVTISPDIADRSGQTLGQKLEHSFYFGDAQPSFIAPGEIMGLLDRDLDGHYPFSSINIDKLRVRAYRVDAQDWASYFEFLTAQERARMGARLRRSVDVEPPTPPGELAIDKTLEGDGVANRFDKYRLDLRDALDEDGHGQVLLMIEPIGAEAAPMTIWLQATDLNLNALLAEDQLMVRALSRVDGREAKDVELSFLRDSNATATTDARGQATLMLPEAPSAQRDRSPLNMLIARRAGDVVLLPEAPAKGSAGAPQISSMGRMGMLALSNDSQVRAWARAKTAWLAAKPLKRSPDSRVERDEQIFTMDDQGSYLPGETIHIRGWVRVADEQSEHLIIPAHRTIYYALMGVGHPKTQSAPIAEDGSFKVDIKLPDDPALIHMSHPEIAFHTNPRERDPYMHQLHIPGATQETWRLHATPPPYRGGQSITLGLSAAIPEPARFAGAQSDWTLRAGETDHVLPGLSVYRFGRALATPGYPSRHAKYRAKSQTTQRDYHQRLNPNGASQISLELEHAELPVPMQIEADIKVTDINQNIWPIKTEPLTVFPAENLVGLRVPEQPFRAGETMRITGIVADLGGIPRAGRTVEVNAVRVEPLGPDQGVRVFQESRQDCKWVSEVREKACDFEAQTPGVWRVTALTHDPSGRPAMSQIFVDVEGEKDVDGEKTADIGASPKFGIRADKERYAPDPKLSVEITALEGAKKARDTRAFHLKVRDARGEPVPNSQVFLSVADRDFLSTSSPQLSSERLYERLGPSWMARPKLSTQNTQDYLVSSPTGDAPNISSQTDSISSSLRGFNGSRIHSAKKDTEEAAEKTILDETLSELWTRQNRSSALLGSKNSTRYSFAHPRPRGVDAPAIFEQTLRTDDKGEATVELPQPDTPTRFPLRAVALHGVESIGQTDAYITLDAPLTLRPLLPDSVQAGQAFKVAVLVENRGDKAATVELVARGANLALKDPNGQTLTVAPNAQATLHLEATAGQAGEGVLQVGLRSGERFISERVRTPIVGP